MAGAFAAEYRVELGSKMTLLVDLVLTDHGWRVCDVEPGAGR
jgi:hypothetical protein